MVSRYSSAVLVAELPNARALMGVAAAPCVGVGKYVKNMAMTGIGNGILKPKG